MKKNTNNQNDPSITHSFTVRISGSGKYTPATIERLAGEWPLLRVLDLSSNIISKYGPETSKQLVKFLQLTNVDMGFNYLKEHAIETAKHLAIIPNLQTVSMRGNDLLENDILAIVDIFFTSSVSFLDIGDNNLSPQYCNEINIRVRDLNDSYKHYIEELHVILQGSMDIPIDLIGIVESYIETNPIQIILE